MLSKVLWNLSGQAIPMVVGLLTTPVLIYALGDDRFGLLSIAWVVVGYLSLFDFGLGRAMTRQIAVRISLGQQDSLGVVFWSAIIAMLFLGVVGAGAGIWAAPILVTSVLNVPDWLQGEARSTLVILSFGIPVTIISTGLRGVLEAFQDFRRVGMIRFLNGLATFLVPFGIVLWTENITIIAAALVLARLGIAVVNLLMCARISPNLVRWHAPDQVELKDLLTVGGWMTVSNVISPIMNSLDRFLLGALLTVGAITYYATPYDVVTKALIIPAAITGVLFPAFARSAHSGRTETLGLFSRSWNMMFLSSFPLAFAMALAAYPALALWLDEDFAQRSTSVVQWIAFGVLANSMAQVPFTFLQASGASRSVAFIHLFELPIYLGLLYTLVLRFGITGAAMAWTVRATLDLILLLIVALRPIVAGSQSLQLMLPQQLLLLLLMIAGTAFSQNVLATASVAVAGLVISCGLLIKELLPRIRHITFFRERLGGIIK